MDKRQFAEQVITEVRSLSLSSVLSTRMDLINRYGNFKGLCPFHNDGHIGSFVVTDKKSIWKCFACGVGGDSIKFVSLFEGINYLESAFKIALEYNIINSSEYEEYWERKRYSSDLIGRIERKYSDLNRKKMESEIADNETLDKVFRLFIEECALSEQHKNHLMNDRHLSVKEIEEGMYFTFPTRHKMSSFSNRLRKDFGDKVGTEILQNIPGFYKKKSDNLWTFSFNKGIGIGIQNVKGQVVGIQIRHDEKKDETSSRYVWFSSSFASFDDKFEYGTSSGSPIDVVYPEKITNQYVYITEGRFKAQLLAKKMGAVVISVQGVGSWRGIAKELENIMTSPILKERLSDKVISDLNGSLFWIKSVLVAFDADMNYKVQVFEQLRKMTDALEKIDDFKYPVYYLNWNENLGKGIDDVFINKKAFGIKRYDKQKWDKKYEQMIQYILDNEDYLDIKKVPAKIVQKYYHEYFADFTPLGEGRKSEKHIKHLNK